MLKIKFACHDYNCFCQLFFLCEVNSETPCPLQKEWKQMAFVKDETIKLTLEKNYCMSNNLLTSCGLLEQVQYLILQQTLILEDQLLSPFIILLMGDCLPTALLRNITLVKIRYF